MNYSLEERRRAKMTSEHKIISLGKISGKSTLDVLGAVDNRLFNGDNKLHAVYEDFTGMWKLHYELGQLPGGLQMKFTTFPDLLTHVKNYYRKRNVEVTDVTDAL